MACVFASNAPSNTTIWTSLGADLRRRLLRAPPKCCWWPSLKKKLVRQITAVGSNPARAKPFARRNPTKRTLFRHITDAGSSPGSFRRSARRNPSFAVHNVDAETEAVEVPYDWYLPVGRRLAMGFMSVFCAQSYVPVARGSVSKRVRLKDVENPKLQDALRAAVAGDLENAEKLFSELIAEDPENASVWSNRGSVRLSMNEFEGATRDLSEAIKLAPEAPVPFLNRAIAFEALGRYQDAIEDCKSAIVNDPEEFAAWYNLGNVDLRVQDYDGALVAYERASALAPGIAGYRLKQALVLFQLHRPEEARKLVEGLTRKYPNYAEAHAALAAILWSEDRHSGAEDQFTEAIIREPLYRDIGWVNAELQWPPSIRQAMENFLSIK